MAFTYALKTTMTVLWFPIYERCFHKSLLYSCNYKQHHDAEFIKQNCNSTDEWAVNEYHKEWDQGAVTMQYSLHGTDVGIVFLLVC